MHGEAVMLSLHFDIYYTYRNVNKEYILQSSCFFLRMLSMIELKVLGKLFFPKDPQLDHTLESEPCPIVLRLAFV